MSKLIDMPLDDLLTLLETKGSKDIDQSIIDHIKSCRNLLKQLKHDGSKYLFEIRMKRIDALIGA
jgi:hypothetical protein